MSVIWQQRTHGMPKRHEQADRAFARTLYILVGVVGLLGALYLALIASNISLSRQIWALHHQLGEIRRENAELTLEAARLSSIEAMKVRSIELGYQPVETFEYMTVEVR
jgi:cell division protein FtsB